MPASSTLPVSLLAVLGIVRSCFTAPTFETFVGLLTGMITAPGPRTVTGMLKGAGLSQDWSHDRVHTFFSRAVWEPGQIGSALATAVIATLLPAGADVRVIVDDTLFRRRGPHVWAAGWAHDGSARGKNKIGYGNTWVVAAIVLDLPFLRRPVALPVLARLWHGKGTPSRCELALTMITHLKQAAGDRTVHVVADAAYHHPAVAALPTGITWTTRLAANAALSSPPPAPVPGRRGRPRLKGDRLGTLTQIAAGATWRRTRVRRYGHTDTVRVAALDVQWYAPWKNLPVRLVLLKDTSRYYDLALITTDLNATPEQIITAYATRWGIEVVFEQARQNLGVGQARNRAPRAVERTVPFGLHIYTIVILWYAHHGNPTADVEHHRALAPWYTTKTEPSFADMLNALNHALTSDNEYPAATPKPTPSRKPQPQQRTPAQAA
jgi:hypothetical protein